MNVGGTSDLGRLQAMQKRSVSVRNSLDRTGKELSTGVRSDLVAATGGNLTRLYAIERSIQRNEAHSKSSLMVDLRLEVMQQSLGSILEPANDPSVGLVSSANAASYADAMTHAGVARVNFTSAVSSLNAQVNGQTLFAGTGTDSAAMADADAILADLDALAAAQTTGAGVIAAIEEYFRKDPAPSGAFYTNGYLGTDEDLAPAEIGENARIDYAVRADDERIVAMLKSQALAAVISGGALAGNHAEIFVVVGEAGRQMLAGKEAIMDVRSQVGVHQEQVENARAALVAESDTLDLARLGILEVDDAEAASYFQAMEAQLEAMYTVTARLATISLTNYLR